jgi:restriction endonuclease S subunit
MLAKLVKIKQCCEVKMGFSFRKMPLCSADGEVLLVQPKDVTAEGIFEPDFNCRIASPSENRLSPGDVLLTSRGRFTAAVFPASLETPCIATSAFLIVTPKKPAELLPDYLALFFNSSEGQMLFKRLNATTTIPFISLNNLETIEIPVPTLEQQKALIALDQMNKAYSRLSSIKLALQKQLLDHELSLLTQEQRHV